MYVYCVLKIKLFEDTESRHDFSTEHSQPAATSMVVFRGRRRSYFILYNHTHRSSERVRQTEPREIRILAGVQSPRRRSK